MVKLIQMLKMNSTQPRYMVENPPSHAVYANHMALSIIALSHGIVRSFYLY